MMRRLHLRSSLLNGDLILMGTVYRTPTGSVVMTLGDGDRATIIMTEQEARQIARALLSEANGDGDDDGGTKPVLLAE